MYKIYVKSYYNTHQNDGKFHPLNDYQGDFHNGELSFNTREKALEHIKTNILGGYWQKHSNGYSVSGTYILSHGEYDRPDYQVRKVK